MARAGSPEPFALHGQQAVFQLQDQEVDVPLCGLLPLQVRKPVVDEEVLGQVCLQGLVERLLRTLARVVVRGCVPDHGGHVAASGG